MSSALQAVDFVFTRAHTTHTPSALEMHPPGPHSRTHTDGPRPGHVLRQGPPAYAREPALVGLGPHWL